MNDQERLRKYELRNIAQCDRIAILEAQTKQQKATIEALEQQIWALQNTLTNRTLRTYDGKLE